MAKTKQKEIVETVKAVETVPKYKGSQLLKDGKYNNRVARIVLEADKFYSIAEADELVNKYLEKKG